jgi:hypothetical protein
MVNLISLTVNNLRAKSNINDYNYGQLELMKSYLFLNHFKNDLFNASDKFGEIIVFNPISGESYYDNASKSFKIFENQMYNTKLQDSLNINKHLLSNIEDMAMYNLDSNLRSYNGEDKEKLQTIFGQFETASLASIDLENLYEIQNQFLEAFPEYKERTLTPEINFADNKEVIYTLLQTAIVTKDQQSLTGDFVGMSNFALYASDFKSLIAAIYTHDQEEYNATGKKIQGLMRGLSFVTPDFVQSNDLRNINRIIATANTHIGENMCEQSGKIFEATNKYYNAINFTKISRDW